MAETKSLIPSEGIPSQVILPIGIAFRICLRGIMTRLGRSIVTLLGVSLGTAFLMSVLTSFLARQAVSDEAAIERDVERRIVLLRSQIGQI